MKRNRVTTFALPFLVFFFLFSCNSDTTHDEIETYHPNGKAKMVITYKGEGNEKQKLKEVQYHENGKIYIEGNYLNEKREGPWVSWYPDGKKWSECSYKDGLAEGKITVYYPAGGKRYEGAYTKGLPSGQWIYWNYEGKVIFERDYGDRSKDTPKYESDYLRYSPFTGKKEE